MTRHQYFPLDGVSPAFLLFAGALHVDLAILRRRAWAVGLTATIGVIISTAIVGAGFWFAAGAIGVAVSFGWALVFGALISLTNPVAVLSTLKEVQVPEDPGDRHGRESLFNDGVGLVIFTVLLTAAIREGGGLSALDIGEMLFVEALGGAALGLGAGPVSYRAMRAINDYAAEVLISLALVAGAYTLATKLHMSGPIAGRRRRIADRRPRPARCHERGNAAVSFRVLH